MAHSALSRLPVELHHGINFYLTDADSICLSLTCKHLYTIYAPPRLRAFSPKSFWSMLLTDDDAAQEKIFKQWITRNEVLPRLRAWIERVIDDANPRAEHASPIDHLHYWEICVGCASFKVYTNSWEEGLAYQYWINSDRVFEYLIGKLIGKRREILKHFVLGGKFCASCKESWGGLRAP